MEMQNLRKPPCRRVLRPLQSILLRLVIWIALGSEAVCQAREILVVKLYILRRDHLIRVLFELRSEGWIMLRS